MGGYPSEQSSGINTGEDSFAASQGPDDDGPYFDMDLALPLLWEKVEDNNNGSNNKSKCAEEFEFRISVSARSAGVSNPVDLSPADDLFYKGQLLPLHLPPRLQMVRNLSPTGEEPKAECCTSDSANSSGSGLWSKDSNSDSASSRDSSGSSRDSCFSNGDSRPAEEKAPASFWKSAAKWKLLPLLGLRKSAKIGSSNEKAAKVGPDSEARPRRPAENSLFIRDPSGGEYSGRFQKRAYHSFSYPSRRAADADLKEPGGGNRNRSAREVFQKYLRMMRPLYEKVSQRYDHQGGGGGGGFLRMEECGSNAVSVVEDSIKSSSGRRWSSHVSFSGNLRIPRRNSGVGSCPSSMRSSPSHSGVLSGAAPPPSGDSTMEELQNAIQGAIAHCKSSHVNPCW